MGNLVSGVRSAERWGLRVHPRVTELPDPDLQVHCFLQALLGGLTYFLMFSLNHCTDPSVLGPGLSRWHPEKTGYDPALSSEA